MDHYILECTKANPEQSQNRFFVQGDPGAILVVELRGDDANTVAEQAQELEKAMRAAGFGYHFPYVTGDGVKKVWDLRKAGLGLLSNLPGDEKAVAVIEDTAVDVQDLPAFIAEFNEILTANQLYCVHYAHAGSGELHLRPIINLKTDEGHQQFRHIAEEIARLVKKYQGSLSGEHGDGRLRGEFIPWMVGEANYQLMRDLKSWWDPKEFSIPIKLWIRRQWILFCAMRRANKHPSSILLSGIKIRIFYSMRSNAMVLEIAEKHQFREVPCVRLLWPLETKKKRLELVPIS
jgi:hypothetical protein